MSKHAEQVKTFTATRDRLIARAVRLRQIAPDRAEDFKRLYDADARGITHLFTAPVEDGGLMAGNAAAVAPFDPVPDEYPAEWIAGGRPGGGVAFEDQQAVTEAVAGSLPRPGGTVRSDSGESRVTLEP